MAVSHSTIPWCQGGRRRVRGPGLQGDAGLEGATPVGLGGMGCGFPLQAFQREGCLAGNSGGQAGCQPAIQPIANRRYLAGDGDCRKFVPPPSSTNP